MPPKTAILVQTHIFDRGVQRLHADLQTACLPGETLFVLVHAPAGTTKPAEFDDVLTHFVTTPEIRTPDFPGKSFGEPWSIWEGGHTDLIALHFARQHPDFDYFWVIEYDVRFTGKWRTFFDHFANTRADLLTTTVRSYEDHPGWHWWFTATDPNGDRMPNAGMRFSFMPLFRFSRAAFQEMERRYREGYSGHTELTWTSFLDQAGLIVEDLGGNGAHVGANNRGRFYSNNVHSGGLNPGSLVWRPARIWPGLRRNWLYHPIKPPVVAIKDRWGTFFMRARRKSRKIARRLLRLDP